MLCDEYKILNPFCFYTMFFGDLISYKFTVFSFCFRLSLDEYEEQKKTCDNFFHVIIFITQTLPYSADSLLLLS